MIRTNISKRNWLGTLLAFIAMVPFFANGQNTSAYSQSDDLYERVWFASDRDVYIPGDEIRLSLATIDGAYSLPINFSSVVYIELFTDEGGVIVQVKSKLENGRGSTVLKLPKKLNTEFYYIRAYTNYQKNFGAESFMVQKIRIVNPFGVVAYESLISERDTIEHYAYPDVTFQGDTLFMNFHDSLSANASVALTCNGISVGNHGSNSDSLKKCFPLQLMRGHFCARFYEKDSLVGQMIFTDSLSRVFTVDTARAGIYSLLISDSSQFADMRLQKIERMFKEGIINEVEYKSMLSENKNHETKSPIDIANIVAIRADHQVFSDTYIASDKDVTLKSSFQYSPEFDQDYIFGSVDTFNLEKLPKYILASYQNEYSWFKPALVQPDGRFRISVGDAELQEQMYFFPTDSSQNVTLNLEDEFYPEISSISHENYIPEQWLGPYLKSLMVTVQLKDAFAKHASNSQSSGSVFYGRADEEVVFDQFISLPTFEDYVLELMPSVYVRKKKKKKYLRISDYDFRGFVGDNPLLLIDGIPYYNHETVVNLTSKEIDRVLVLNHKLTYFNAQFDGILDVRLKENYSGTIEIPKNAGTVYFIPVQHQAVTQGSEFELTNVPYWDPSAESADMHEMKSGMEESPFQFHIQGISGGKYINAVSPAFDVKQPK